MSLINKGNVATGNIIEAQDVLNIIEALDGTSDTTTVIATGSFTGSFIGSLSGSFYGEATGSLYGTSSWAISCSQAETASYTAFALTASHALNAGTGSITNPGGSDQQIQYNNSGSFGGNSSLVFVYTSQSLQQGNITKAKGLYSHAEGWNNTASGSYTHAEGKDTIAIGLNSHTEGKDTLTLGDYAHAEGEFTTAQGRASHAEGLRTIASASYQLVVGQYNITSSVQSAFIVGNGTGLASRKNLVFAAGNEVQITGSLLVTGSATVKGLTQSAGNNNVLTYNSTTGLLSYTASSAVGSTGGGSQFTYEVGGYVPTEGGIVFDRWISGSNEWYLVVSLEDVTTSIPFSNITATTITGADSYWDGETNTNDIVAQPGHTTSAAQDCLDYVNSFGTAKTDWYLPSITELTKLWSNMFLVSKAIDENFGSQMITNSDTQQPIYWSSTEAKSSTAWSLNFSSGTTGTSNKTVNEDVRAVRKFSI